MPVQTTGPVSGPPESRKTPRLPRRPLSPEDCLEVLRKASVCSLATCGEDGAPYVTPLNFALAGNVIYVHGSREGTRNDNIAADPRVSLCAFTGGDIRTGDEPCSTGTLFSSVVVTGTARIVGDPAERAAALDALVAKYVPQHSGKPMPERNVAATGVIAVDIVTVTGRRRR
ncbi:MAG: pyridoxamine 5'-phosphate oxidase family protein [Deltaproteobacteria bacterium]|jgi:nitroimidazol reductase NimA-like FMN-containing flavoprotein (pyridoxamine 5'-phosphate oxidase superfamily)|nr:pyridoxamine 5'-phosphate oxidase family protein [Deltaproteobacteria bacterium]